MFRSIFKLKASKVVLGAALLGGGTALVTLPASAQAPAARQFVLSSSSRRVLNDIMRSSTPYGRRLVWNALLKIGPERAEAQLAPLTGVSRYELQARLQLVGAILQMLPMQYHQAFVNGLFQASAEEDQFANQIIYQIIQTLNAQGAVGPSNSDFLYAQRWNRMLTYDTFRNRP